MISLFRLLLVYLFYWAGDLVSRLCGLLDLCHVPDFMIWPVYRMSSWLLAKSSDLDVDDRLWKSVKDNDLSDSS